MVAKNISKKFRTTLFGVQNDLKDENVNIIHLINKVTGKRYPHYHAKKLFLIFI